MIFCIYRIDRAGSGPERNRLRQPHLAYLAQHATSILCAGALLAEDSTGDDETSAKPEEIGSLYLVRFDSSVAAQAFAHNDPFHLAGLFEDVHVHSFEARLGTHLQALIGQIGAKSIQML